MISNKPKTNFEKLMSLLQTDAIDAFVKKSAEYLKLLADLVPSVETPESKRRRQEEFQAALIAFCKHELVVAEIISQFLANLRKEEFEKDAFLEKTLQERRIQENKEIEKRSFAVPDEDTRQATLEKIVRETIEKLDTQIKQLDAIIQELFALENSIQESINERLKRIKQVYQTVADESQNLGAITFRYPHPEDKRKEGTQFEIYLADIFNYLKDAIPEKLRNHDIKPHEIAEQEKKMTEYFLLRSLEEHMRNHHPAVAPEKIQAHVTELNNSARFQTIKDRINDRVEACKENKQDVLQTETAFLAIEQEEQKRAQAAIEAGMAIRKQCINARALFLRNRGINLSESDRHDINVSLEKSAKQIEELSNCASSLNSGKSMTEAAEQARAAASAAAAPDAPANDNAPNPAANPNQEANPAANGANPPADPNPADNAQPGHNNNNPFDNDEPPAYRSPRMGG